MGAKRIRLSGKQKVWMIWVLRGCTIEGRPAAGPLRILTPETHYLTALNPRGAIYYLVKGFRFRALIQEADHESRYSCHAGHGVSSSSCPDITRSTIYSRRSTPRQFEPESGDRYRAAVEDCR